MHTEANEPLQPEPRKRKGIFFWLGRAFLSLIILTFVLVLIVHLPPVQRYGINKLTASLSKNLNSKVSIGGFSINPVSDLTLKNIFIGSPEHPEDTLLYADRLYVDYKRLWDIFLRRITITQIGIDNGLLNIHRVAGDSLTNLDLALLRVMPARDTTKGDFILDLKTLNAKTLSVRVDDESSGTLMGLDFKRIDVELDTLDIIRKYFAIHDLDIDQPYIRFINRPPGVDSIAPSAASSKAWSLDINYLRLQDGKILIDNQTKPVAIYPNEWGIDYAHMMLEDADIQMENLVVRGWDFKAKNIDIHILHQNGFEINTLGAASARISSDSISLEKLKIKTPDSDIHNSISLLFSGYRDFQSFVDSVRIIIPDANIDLKVNDLLAIAPGLAGVEFFKDNADKRIFLEGKVSGTINRLRIKNMNAGLGDLSLTGDLRSRDLAVKGSQLISLDLQKSAFSAAAFKSVFPKMKIPPMLTKVGQINFVGKFDGYPDDFVAFGTFNTSLGAVTLDMNLNMAKGLAQGTYSGSITMREFDLGALIDNKDLGRVSMSGRVIEGKGLTSTSLSADVTAQLTSLTYKGYTYRNARVDGQISGKQFNGTLDINDPNVDMHFEGDVDMRDSLPKLDFIARIDSIHFHQLGLSKDSLSVQGIFDMDMTVGRFDQLQGTLHGEKIILSVKEVDYPLDSLDVIASTDSTTGEKLYIVDSDILSGSVSGVFDPATLTNQMQHYLHDQYPRVFDQPKKPLTFVGNQRFKWNIEISDSKDWFQLAGLKDLSVKELATQGTFNLNEKHTEGFIDLPEVHYGNINVYATTIDFSENSGLTSVNLDLIAADVNESFFLEDVLVKGTLTDDSVKMNFKTDQFADIISELDLDIDAYSQDGDWTISFNPISLVMLGADWKVPVGNKVTIKKDEFILENFELISTDQKIVLDDIDHKGLEAYISGFDISYLNQIWINDKFDFAGKYTLDFEADNLYDIKQMKAVLSLPDLLINNVPYGQLVLNASMKDPKDSVRIDLTLLNNETSLVGVGAYVPPIKSIPKEDQNYLRLDLVAKEFPLDFLEFLLGGNIRETEGSIDMTLSLKGKTNKLDPNGKGRVYNGSTVIDYLGSAYSFHDQAFSITPTMIDLSGTKLFDVYGNNAIIQGGLTHRYLRNLGLNITLTSDKIVGLDVTSEENNVFYGKGIGSVYARFTGTVSNPTMVINTTTAKGTHIYIPLSGSTEGTDKDFVVFLENGLLPVTVATPINLSGINLTMNMTITDEAIIEIIFDENTGEVLRAVGTGDLTMSMNRTGNFSMYGNYTISEGDYLFTNFRVVRKPFILKRGGVIQWDGDPYNATLNVQALYKDLSAPVYPLIAEYELQGTVLEEAKTRTRVDLTMTLTGSLLKPNIAFDIAFPDLTGEIKGYADSKVQILKANQNAMNEQIVGLLITRSFLPSSGLGAGQLAKGIDNTLSELISATLSSYLGGLLGNLIPEAGAFTGIDFQIGVDLPITGGVGTDPTEEEIDPNVTSVDIALPIQFFNDRLEVLVGGNYVTGATTLSESGEYLAGDVTFKYQLTPDRRLSIRAYNRNTLTVEGRKNKVGAGITYQREYDSLLEIFGKKKKG